MLRYRPEIDGLRALAIAPVVLYHAGLSAVSGGYVGVDVFFVISGFLITSLLLQDLRAGEFSLVKFYERRCRRIVPPLAVMAAVVSVLAWVYLFPYDFINFGRSLAAMASLWANVFFYKGSGYFDAASWAKPLLHTWSLSVEEQFYLVFPLILALVWKKGRTRLPLILGFLVAASLGLSAVRMPHDPEGVFYLLQFRAWELLLGAVTAALPDVRLGGGITAALGSLLGLGLILVPAVTYDSQTAFPGPAALPPCLGTVLLIFIHGPGYSVSPVGRLLASRPFTGLGQISYSLYLWHWPLLVLPRYGQGGRPLAGAESFAWVTLAVVLSILSWRLVERPVRERRVLPRRRPLFSVTVAALAVLALFGRTVKWHDGFPGRLPPLARLFAEAAPAYARHGAIDDITSEPKLVALKRENPSYRVARMGAPGSWPPDFLLVGDSHAQHWLPAFDTLARRYGVSGIHFGIQGPPLLGAWSTCQLNPGLPPIGQLTARVLDFIQQENIKNVIIANYYGFWIGYPQRGRTQITACLSDDGSRKTIPEAQAIFDRQLRYTVQVMQSLGLTVWILEDVPDYDESVPHMLVEAVLRDSLDTVGYDRSTYRKRQKMVNESLARLTPLGVRVVKVAETICPDGPCLLFDREGSFYADTDHLTLHGALRFKDALRPMIETIAETKPPATRSEDSSKTREE
jgi:peptidoglycan/LPS O-acetylase OafA/YrhL